MEKAFKLAQDAGYEMPNPYVHYSQILMDPLFWQALGKKLGWGAEMTLVDEKGHPKEWCYFYHCPIDGEVVVGELEECPNECQTENAPIASWLYEWQNYIEHIASGKSPDDFLIPLIEKNEEKAV